MHAYITLTDDRVRSRYERQESKLVESNSLSNGAEIITIIL